MMYTDTTTKGFTLVETLVAISILLLVIISPMSIAQKGIQSSFFATEQVSAVFLAQEAIEAVRQLRDKQGLEVYDNPTLKDAHDWINDDTIQQTCGTGCSYDVKTQSFSTCLVSNNCVVKIDNDKVYTHQSTNGAVDTKFTRVVTTALSGNDISIVVEVTWNPSLFAGTQKKVRLQTWLYNQYSRFEEAP